MAAQVLTGHGGLEMLEYRTDCPVPKPGASDVLVEVAACGINNTDVNTRVGWYEGGGWGSPVEFPRIQGADPVGRVVAVGSAVSPDRVGQRAIIDPWIRDGGSARYLGSEIDGGFAGYVMVPAANAWSVDSALTDAELATIACSYSTAEHMLVRAEVARGQWILVTGSSGGVGSALIQLAKLHGMQVAAITSAAKTDQVKGLGADVVFVRGAKDLAAAVSEATGGIDVFADVVGGDGFAQLLETLLPGGHYVVSGAVGGAQVELDLRTLYLKDLTFHGATVVPPRVFGHLVDYLAGGDLRPVVDRVYPLAEMPAAQEYFLERRHVGSVVIEIGG